MDMEIRVTRVAATDDSPEYEASLYTRHYGALQQAYGKDGRPLWSGWKESPEAAKAALAVKLTAAGISLA